MNYQLILCLVCLLLDTLAVAGVAAQKKTWKLPYYASNYVFWSARQPSSRGYHCRGHLSRLSGYNLLLSGLSNSLQRDTLYGGAARPVHRLVSL